MWGVTVESVKWAERESLGRDWGLPTVWGGRVRKREGRQPGIWHGTLDPCKRRCPLGTTSRGGQEAGVGEERPQVPFQMLSLRGLGDLQVEVSCGQLEFCLEVRRGTPRLWQPMVKYKHTTFPRQMGIKWDWIIWRWFSLLNYPDHFQLPTQIKGKSIILHCQVSADAPGWGCLRRLGRIGGVRHPGSTSHSQPHTADTRSALFKITIKDKRGRRQVPQESKGTSLCNFCSFKFCLSTPFKNNPSSLFLVDQRINRINENLKCLKSLELRMKSAHSYFLVYPSGLKVTFPVFSVKWVFRYANKQRVMC